MPTTSLFQKGSVLKVTGSQEPEDYFKGYLHLLDEQGQHLIFDMWASDGFRHEQGANDPIFRYKPWWDTQMTQQLRELGYHPLTVIFQGFVCAGQDPTLLEKHPHRIVARGAYCFKIGAGFIRIEGRECDVEIP
jgi:hypothetical protein